MPRKHNPKDWRRVCQCGRNFTGRSAKCNLCAHARKTEVQRLSNMKRQIRNVG